ncbi:MAG: hypothetical protein EOO27_02350 [Comamonadaceae bacterium]|nr:MAG: hypothetical protein EOO27_02350 [Comamonadaceae bacterium]
MVNTTGSSKNIKEDKDAKNVETSNNPAEPQHDTDSQLEAQNKALQQNQIDRDAEREAFEAEKAKFEADKEKFEKSQADAQRKDEESDAERSDRIAKERAKSIKDNKDLDADAKKILQLHDEGVQLFEIAKRVYKFVNNQTVGQVLLTIRKEHADDWNEIEDINSTKGYTGF